MAIVFTKISAILPIATFSRSNESAFINIAAAWCDQSFNTNSLTSNFYYALSAPNRSKIPIKIIQLARKYHNKGKLPNFIEADFVLVAQKDLFAGENLFLCCHGSRRVIEAMNDFDFKMEGLCNGHITNIHGLFLNYFFNFSLDTKVFIFNVLSFEKSMSVVRLMRFFSTEDGLKVQIQ